MYYKRHIEATIKRIAKRKPVIVITGARQVGKSTMLKNTFSDINNVSLNRPLVRSSAAENPSLFFELNKPPVIVDEIQKVPELFDYVKDVVDTDNAEKTGQFYLTGSQSQKLMERVSDSLAGRAGIVKMLGLSCRELDGVSCSEVFKPTKTHIDEISKASPDFDYDTLITRIHKGSFPELYKTESDLDDWSDYYDSYFQTYIEKDVKDVLNIRDEIAFVKFVRACASLSGEILNFVTLAEMCGKDVGTAKSWLSVLVSSGLVYMLEPYHNNFSKRLVKSPKMYFLDTGLACWLLGWNTPQQLINGAAWGHIFESFVFAEILKSYYNAGKTTPQIFYYRDTDKNEIDLLIKDGDVLHPIEIKTTSDPKKAMVSSFKQIEKIPDMKIGEGAVICLAKEVLPLGDEVWILPANLI
ncbi:MAG: ATP-binding protein [Ruminococcus sp.]|jgi:predicted AAA+ superfamily ATPase|nr:ATP-binding protein [Ruminococcus sp.]